MGRFITSLTLSEETLRLINEAVSKARVQRDFAERLGLLTAQSLPSPPIEITFDAEGLSPENRTAIFQILRAPESAGSVVDYLNQVLSTGQSGEVRVLEALRYLNSARKVNSRAVKRAEALRAKFLSRTHLTVNNSRVAEALILIGMESLGNGRDRERSSKSGISQSSYATKAARKSVNSTSRHIDAATASI